MVKSNPVVVDLVQKLYSQSTEKKVAIWKNLAQRLDKPNRNYAKVNLNRLDRNTQKGDTVVVPGKVLGAGELDHTVTVAAISWSETAKSKIEAASGRILTINEVVDENPKGSGIRIIG